jgi:hypothetical protein
MKENRFDGPFAMCGRQIHEEREVEPNNVGALQSVPRLRISRIHLSLDTGSDISCC